MVGGLKVPACQPGLGVDCNDGAGKFVHNLRAVAAEVIGRGIPRRHVNEAEFVIGRRQTPDIGSSSGVETAFWRHHRFAFAADVPSPKQLTRAGIVPTHDSRRFLGLLVVHDPATDNQCAAGNGRR